MPNCGLDNIFSGNKFVSIGLIISVMMAIVVWVVLEKTKFGFELKATGMNKNAAKYCGMKEKRNTIVTMMIAGGLAGLGAAVFYLSGIEPGWYSRLQCREWALTESQLRSWEA